MITGRSRNETNCDLLKGKMIRLTTTLCEQQTEAAKLDAAVAGNLKEIGYGG